MASEGTAVFTEHDRSRVSDRVLELAHQDSRIVSGAVVGSLADASGDKWSDLDLAFAVAEENQKVHVLDGLANTVRTEFGAFALFDLPFGATLFRVLLLPNFLQVDLSVTPASHFGPHGPRFKLLFGSFTEQPTLQAPQSEYLLGYATHHLVRARFCIERGRLWQAEYWLGAARDYLLSLACLHRGLPWAYGRGIDQLPSEIQTLAQNSFVHSLDHDELMRALSATVHFFLSTAERHPSDAMLDFHTLTRKWSEGQ